MVNIIEDPKQLPENNSENLQPEAQNQQGLNPGTRSLYSTDDESNDMVDLASLGFDTTIKQKKSEILDPSQLNDTVVSSVMAAEDRPVNSEPVLEKLDSFEDDLNLSLVIERENQRKQSIIKYSFFGLLALTIVLGAVFFTDATSLLGYTSIQESSESTTKQALSESKVDKAFSHLYTAAISSQNLSFLAVEFHNEFIVFSNKLSSESEVQASKKELESIKKSIINELELINTELIESRKVLDSNELKVELIGKLNSKEYLPVVNPLVGDKLKKSQFIEEQQLLNEISNLVSNQDISFMFNQSEYENLDNKQFIEYLISLFSKYRDSHLKQLAILSLERSSFISVLGELDFISKSFDPDFTLFDTREDYILRHTSYGFDVNNSSISVQTEIQTDSPDTFTLVADLEDALKQSPVFDGLNVVNFQKQPSNLDGTFRTNLSLSFQFSKL